MSIKSILSENGVKLSPVSKAQKLINSGASEADICKAICTTKAYQVPAVEKYVNGVLNKKTAQAPEKTAPVEERKVRSPYSGEPKRG